MSLERDHQLVVNRKAVQRLMREMDIAGISPGPNLSRRNPEHQVYSYLLRNRVAARPNHVWAIDITSIRLVTSWIYLVAVLDLYARYVGGTLCRERGTRRSNVRDSAR